MTSKQRVALAEGIKKLVHKEVQKELANLRLEFYGALQEVTKKPKGQLYDKPDPRLVAEISGPTHRVPSTVKTEDRSSHLGSLMELMGMTPDSLKEGYDSEAQSILDLPRSSVDPSTQKILDIMSSPTLAQKAKAMEESAKSLRSGI